MNNPNDTSRYDGSMYLFWEFIYNASLALVGVLGMITGLGLMLYPFVKACQ